GCGRVDGAEAVRAEARPAGSLRCRVLAQRQGPADGGAKGPHRDDGLARGQAGVRAAAGRDDQGRQVAAQQPVLRRGAEELRLHLRQGRCRAALPEEAPRGHAHGVPA
ncbi:hypothetical protein BN1708_019945, partial [Verticillium longisporum]